MNTKIPENITPKGQAALQSMQDYMDAEAAKQRACDVADNAYSDSELLWGLEEHIDWTQPGFFSRIERVTQWSSRKRQQFLALVSAYDQAYDRMANRAKQEVIGDQHVSADKLFKVFEETYEQKRKARIQGDLSDAELSQWNSAHVMLVTLFANRTVFIDDEVERGKKAQWFDCSPDFQFLRTLNTKFDLGIPHKAILNYKSAVDFYSRDTLHSWHLIGYFIKRAEYSLTSIALADGLSRIIVWLNELDRALTEEEIETLSLFGAFLNTAYQSPFASLVLHGRIAQLTPTYTLPPVALLRTLFWNAFESNEGQFIQHLSDSVINEITGDSTAFELALLYRQFATQFNRSALDLAVSKVEFEAPSSQVKLTFDGNGVVTENVEDMLKEYASWLNITIDGERKDLRALEQRLNGSEVVDDPSAIIEELTDFQSLYLAILERDLLAWPELIECVREDLTRGFTDFADMMEASVDAKSHIADLKAQAAEALEAGDFDRVAELSQQASAAASENPDATKEAVAAVFAVIPAMLESLIKLDDKLKRLEPQVIKDTAESEDLREQLSQSRADAKDLTDKLERTLAENDKLERQLAYASAQEHHQPVQIDTLTSADLLQAVVSGTYTLEDALMFAASSCPGLQILPSALESAKESSYVHTDKLLSALLSLGGKYLESIKSGTPALEAAKACGLGGVYAAQESKTVKSDERLRKAREFTVDGKTELFKEHLTLGGGGKDPRYVLQVHFKVIGDKLYIGRAGEHLDTASIS